MLTYAFILESTPQVFGNELLCLFAKNLGKIFCATKLPFKSPSVPALIEIELIQKKEGLYTSQNIQIEDTYPEIRRNETARKNVMEIQTLFKKVLPVHTALDEVWHVFSSLLPCLHLFSEEKTPLFLIAYTLATSQGMDLSWIKEAKHLDQESKELLLAFPSKSFEDIASMKCPDQAVQFLLEELGYTQTT